MIRFRRLKSKCFILIYCIIFVFLVDIFLNGKRNVKILVPKLTDNFIIDTSGCKIPDMDVTPRSMTQDTYGQEAVTCDYENPPLVESNDTFLFINKSSLSAYGVESMENLVCCYRSFWRIEPQRSDLSYTNFSKKCTPFKDPVQIPEEFVRVSCSYKGEYIYKDYFSFVPRKVFKNTTWTKRPLNVLIVGIDSLSRLNFLRQMPKTERLLREMKAFQFLGYNKVGDNTFPNLIPMLTGLTIHELSDECWTYKSHLDRCSFIWKRFQEKGFATSFSEDCSWLSTFNYQKRGFKKQPTDYFHYFFYSVAEREIGNKREMNMKYCIGARYGYRMMLDYTGKFVRRMDAFQRPYFAFFWYNSISHDFFSRPKLSDADYAYLLSNLQENGYLKNTVLILLSDHGMRWGQFARSYQGILENRLPVLYVKLPDWFQNTYKNLTKNVMTNTKRLVTSFDLHETLEDLSNPYEISHPVVNIKKRGYSLFEPIPEDRTCDDAAISDHWCSCKSKVTYKVDKDLLEKAATFAVDYLNMILEDFEDCATLSLDEIVSANYQKYSKKGDAVVENYMVTFITVPNYAFYLATVKIYNIIEGTQIFRISASISRLNLYGSQSHCISDPIMKLYCYCNDLL